MTGLVRFTDWSPRLTAYLSVATQRSFEWGIFDCALNASDAVLAITGTDLAADVRGRYDSEESAYALLRDLGYNSTMEFTEDRLPKASTILHAFSGDLAAFRHGEHDIVGVVQKNRIYSPSPGRLGMGSVNLFKAHTVFKVGTA